MKITTILLATTMLVATAACTTSGTERHYPDSMNMSNDSRRAMDISGSEFVNMAASSDMFEVKSSQLALKRSRNAEVRKFASQMIKDHTKSTQKLKAVVKTSDTDYTVPKVMNTKHMAIYEALRNASNAEFNEMYMDAQQTAHDEAVTLFANYANYGDDTMLKEHARKTLPTLEMHQEHANHF